MPDKTDMNALPILPPASSLILPNRSSHSQYPATPPLVSLPPLARYHYPVASDQNALPPLFKLSLDTPLPLPGVSPVGSESPQHSSELASQAPRYQRKRSSSSGASQPRKKRECPVCHNYFSNLTTHRAIHIQNSKPFTCQTCSRSFKRLNDLLRHEKCHLSKLGEWEFRCPFFNTDPKNKSENCHHSGHFTRCDTYKNHLKAIHFKYPPNTPKSERSKVNGFCRECGMYFNNVQEWLANHIETNQCAKQAPANTNFTT
ncbi:hypothetical protein KL921_001341 [Ogataea angusta]|uniref:C2H2-type domain-containing protein n=1 Tax=Pichia angusta TaxID=870730 RepID=A0AAN6DG74_PICAN|nr:uncharacterized protein KL928_002578 [Ogataea angusta]KAG7812109.1 hypothetical protein KL921_001341 [Ogataea angusta]KAG7818710.1 hypothetical protein KL928_002578 [Ogataea angusta]